MKAIDKSILIRELQTRVAKLEGGECRLHCSMRREMWMAGYQYRQYFGLKESPEAAYEEWRTIDGGPGS